MTLYLGNNSNLVREATLAATNIVPSSAISRTDTASKLGRGIVAITGPYTGAANETIDVEILDTEGDLARVSQPVFDGVGNGTMTEVTATDDLPAQTVVVTLEDLGSPTSDATAQFQGQQLDAIETGDDGNLITITVDRTNIARAASSYSVPAGGISSGTNEYSGDQWNFGAVTLTSDGKFPVDGSGNLTALRISFGDDPQVYRQFRKFVGSGYVYGLSPAPVRDVPAGTKVWLISGAYQLAITDGTSPETLNDNTTLYSALANIRDNSALVAVDGSVVIANDLAPGGKGVVDVDVFTNAYLTAIVRDGSQQIFDAVISIAATAGAPSEQLTLTATSGTNFRVEGSVSGRLLDLTAGTPYSDGPYDIVVPSAVADPDGDPNASIDVSYKPNGQHGDDPLGVFIRFHDPRLGPAARAGQYVFTWANHPPKPCDGSDAVYTGSIDFVCLGLTGGGGAIVANNAQITLRVQKLVSALRGFLDDNTTPPQTVDNGDVIWAKTVWGIFSDAAAQLDVEAATLDSEFADFQTSHAYVEGTIILVVANGFRFMALTTGTSAGSAPTWPMTPGDAVTSNTVQFVNMGKGPLALFDAAYTAMLADSALLGGQENPQNIPAWTPGTAYAAGVRVVPTIQNGFYYTCGPFHGDHVGNTTGSSGQFEPTWPTADGDQVDEYVAGIGGLTDADTLGIQWTCVEYLDLSVQPGVLDAFFDRYRSQMNDVLFAAGLGSNFDLASTDGDGCWQDLHASGWWESQDGFLPFQNGIYNTTSVQTLDANGLPVNNSTHEFGFGIEVGCEDKLRVGDQLVVTIAGGFSEGGGGYQPGDNIAASLIHGEPIAFTGGQSGTDAITWSVQAGGTALAPYVLSLTSPAAYSVDGIGFLITIGSIGFQLGDSFTFDIENGQFRYRINGGSWSSAADIEDTSITNGLTITFTGGAAPSWQGGDAWSFLAQAINGPDALRQPTDARCSWTGSTLITIVPGGDNGDVVGIEIADHDIPSTATITLTGGTIGFTVPTVTKSIPWAARNIWCSLVSALTCAEWRIAVNATGSANWVYLGEGFTPEMPNGLPEHGEATKIVQLAGFLKRRSIGASIKHTALAEDSVADLLDLLDHACTFDDRRFGYVPNAASPQSGIVSFNPDTLSIDDEFSFQPTDVDNSLQSVTLDLTPVA